MQFVDVEQAAQLLGVSSRRVRQMLADGALLGRRVGHRWVIDSWELERASNRPRVPGRPWTPASAWALLAMADGASPDLTPVERARARKRLEQGLEALANRLRSRANPVGFYAHPAAVARISQSVEVVRTGVSAASDHDADVIAREAFEGYVRTSDLDVVVERFGLEVSEERPNVKLRIIDDAAWPFDEGQAVAGRAVVALDLMDNDEPRTRRAGRRLVATA